VAGRRVRGRSQEKIERGARPISEAVAHRQSVVDHKALAELLDGHKLYPESVNELEVALRLHPDWPVALNNLA
jgi:hypothetical protein